MPQFYAPLFVAEMPVIYHVPGTTQNHQPNRRQIFATMNWTLFMCHPVHDNSYM